MKSVHRSSAPVKARAKPRPQIAEVTKRRYENAWDDNKPYQDTAALTDSPWNRLRRLSSSRMGRVIILAPVGALGAYLLLRRRR